MVVHEDEIPAFIPKRKTQMIILGTMGSINARTINGVRPNNRLKNEDFFYYNNNRNHFWKVIQLLFEPNQEAQKLTIKEKKAFLEKWGIAMINIVQTAEVPNRCADDPSDTVLFYAHKSGRVTFKKVSRKFKQIIQTTPLFFTCRSKKGINDLVNGFLQFNNLDNSISENIWYWPTPTRCNPKARSILWKKEMVEKFGN